MRSKLLVDELLDVIVSADDELDDVDEGGNDDEEILTEDFEEELDDIVELSVLDVVVEDDLLDELEPGLITSVPFIFHSQIE